MHVSHSFRYVSRADFDALPRSLVMVGTFVLCTGSGEVAPAAAMLLC
jgi:hypothetical protein